MRREVETWSCKIGEGEASYSVVVRVGYDELGGFEKSLDMEITSSPLGSPLPMLLAAVCRAITTGLRAGVPIAHYMKPLRGQQFSPHGKTTDPLVPECSSLVDYLARSLDARGIS